MALALILKNFLRFVELTYACVSLTILDIFEIGPVIEYKKRNPVLFSSPSI